MMNFNVGMDVSSPLNVLAFCSHQRHHMIQWVIIFQIFLASLLPNRPFQQERRSITPWGMVQGIPKRLKNIFHRSLATRQWRNKWFTDSPLSLHIQHQSSLLPYLLFYLISSRIPRLLNSNPTFKIESFSLLFLILFSLFYESLILFLSSSFPLPLQNWSLVSSKYSWAISLPKTLDFTTQWNVLSFSSRNESCPLTTFLEC